MGPAKDALRPPRGMRDFYPEDMVLQNRIYAAWRSAAHAFGFQDYDACVVENLELLKRKAGEEIVDQIYTFQDKSGRDLALRPEMTPTLARMIAARQGAITFPVKWTTIAQCFRYERMTKGRKREHYQWNLDIIGEAHVLAEVEVIATACKALETLGLGPDAVRIHFSSRALLSAILAAMDIQASHHSAVFLALDKRGKIPDEQIQSLLTDADVPDAAASRVFELMQVQDLPEALDLIPSDHPVRNHLLDFVNLLDSYRLGPMITFDIGVVRGLAYYTGIVFEAFDSKRAYRAIFGGGRYDNLLADVGGKPTTGVGLGFGDVVIGEILTDSGAAAVPNTGSVTAVGYMDDTQRPTAVRLAAQLRSDGSAVDLATHPEKAKAFFSRVTRGLHSHAAYLGPDDVASGRVRIKDLATREEATQPLPA